MLHVVMGILTKIIRQVYSVYHETLQKTKDGGKRYRGTIFQTRQILLFAKDIGHPTKNTPYIAENEDLYIHRQFFRTFLQV